MADYKILASEDKSSVEASVKSHIAKGYVLGDFTATGYSSGGYSSHVIYAQVVYKPNPAPGFVNNKLAMRTLSTATPLAGGGGGGGSRKARKTRKSRK